MAFAPALLAPPDEQTQDAATVATALDPVAVAESQVLPPPIPAAPALPPDALMALASAPPPVAPQAPVDAALAPALPPQGGPALSVLPPPDVAAGTPGTPVEAAQKRVAEVDALGREIQQVGDERTDLEKQQADQKAQLANERQAALSKLQERQELHRTQAANTVAELRSKAETEPYHTFWESRSIGQNIATGIGLILGGVSWNAGHVNRGIQIVENMMAQDLALQKEKHADLWRAVEAAERGERALDARELRETAAFSAAQGAKADAIAGRLGAMIAANKGKGDTATAKKAMLEFAMRADQHYLNATTAAGAAAHLKEMDEETARHHAEQEKTAALRAAKYKTKGGGTGGAIAAGLDRAAATLTTEIEAAIANKKPLSDGQIRDRAIALGIPAEAKAGRVSLKTIRESIGKETAADAARDRVDAETRQRTVHFRGGTGLAPTVKSAEEFRVFEGSAQQVEGGLDKLAAHFKKYGPTPSAALPEFLRSKLARERIALMDAISLPAKEVGRLGALSGPDKGMLENIAGGNIGVILGDDVGIKNMRGWLERARKGGLSTLGITPGEGASAKGKAPPGSKPGRISDGRAVWKYPDGTIHLADGSEVTTL